MAGMLEKIGHTGDVAVTWLEADRGAELLWNPWDPWLGA